LNYAINYSKVKKIGFLVVDGDVKVKFLSLWLFSTQFVCLQVMSITSFHFSMALDVLLCFQWMHVQWCGFVCMNALIDVNQ
jgi:hypothetical protein